MGRRPKRSDSEPSTGEKKNCMAANTIPKMPIISAVRAVELPKPPMRLGSTGAIMPSASMSRPTVR